MRLSAGTIRAALAARMRELRDSERGFTMLAALTVMIITTALTTAAFVAADSDIGATQNDMYQKQAYAAMQSGINQFVHQLNQDPTYWQTCPSQPTSPVPGRTGNETYSFKPVGANGQTCDSASPIPTMIDTDTGTFSMQFSGSAGTTANPMTRSSVVSFKRPSPLDYLWYTVFETLDPNVYRPDSNDPHDYSKCAGYYRNQPPAPHRPGYCENIDWVSADVMDGPMYTEDEYQICGSPTFGRPGRNDKIQSYSSQLTHDAGGSCGPARPQINGPAQAGVPPPGLPTVNSALRVDALAASRKIFGGTTTITLHGSSFDIDATEESTDGTNWVPSPPQSNLPLDQYPLVYVDNLSGCSSSYSPYDVTYPSASEPECGTVYVHGDYSGPLTIAAANDIVVDGDVTTATSGGKLSGPGILGLVANNFIRVKHDCGDARLGTRVIDAALLALSHSFIVDHYDCGTPLGTLQVNGAIAQRFRGTVGTHSGVTISTGFAKDYTYDDRLKSQQPPYLFDLQNQSWKPFRQTQCVTGQDC
jgi:Tfp pilus assembly protein PilX